MARIGGAVGPDKGAQTNSSRSWWDQATTLVGPGHHTTISVFLLVEEGYHTTLSNSLDVGCLTVLVEGLVPVSHC